MIQRRTQTETYWRQEFELTTEDSSLLYELILDEARPIGAETLVQAVIERHCRREERVIQAELSKGLIYQPQDSYEIGQQIIFPALSYALGTVAGTRTGRNPEYGAFTVIQVEFDDDDGLREFASELEGEHRLNQSDGAGDMMATGELEAPAELYEKYGTFVEEKIHAFLRESEEFVFFKGKWFLKGLLVDIGVGYLNIAEAMIEVNAMPMSTKGLLAEIDLPDEVSQEIRIFSLNYALDADERFDNVGDAGRDIWYLRRLTPEIVVTPPARLAFQVEPYEREDIARELLLIEREIDDEGSGEEVMGPSRPIYKTSITLTYPHWRSGTLPLTVRTRGLFPQAATHHSPIVLIDAQTGSKMQGWVVHQGRYVYGLERWYERHGLPVGALLKLARTRDPRVIIVDFEPRRLKHLWIKVVTVKDGEVVFQMRKHPIACEYDEHLVLGEDRARAIDRVWAKVNAEGDSVFDVMIEVVPKLIELSPQATVHAKAIYSAVNVLKRTPPGPIFANLSTEACFVPMGGGYWTFDEALVGR